MEKWSTVEILRFLELFETQPCLWNPDIRDYRRAEKRSAAVQWIIRQLGVRMTETDIRNKLKNIRSTYVQCLKRVLRAEELGLGDEYAPTLPWFRKADSFMRKYAMRGIIRREQKKNERFARYEDSSASNDQHIPASDCEAEVTATEFEEDDYEDRTAKSNDSHMNDGISKSLTDSSTQKKNAMESTGSEEEEFEPRNSDNSIQHSSRNFGQVRSPENHTNPNRNFVHQEGDHGTRNEVFHRDPEASHSKRKRLGHSPSQEGDEFDTFSKHVGNQLRHLPLERALRCQDAIHSLLMKERIEHCQELTRTRTGSSTCAPSGSAPTGAMASNTSVSAPTKVVPQGESSGIFDQDHHVLQVDPFNYASNFMGN